MHSMNKKTIASLISLLLAAGPMHAQFYTNGDDPGRMKWYSFTTKDFRMIYPEGLDSLAKVYATKLEEHKADVGRSIGVKPNGNYRRPMPVVLRGFTANANGMVVWTPRRMELQTAAEVHAPGSLDWIDELTIHESRHVAQMQLGHGKGYRLTDWMLGELVPGAMSAVYMGPALLEGDAVVAETALTSSGRGRSADFLEYYMAAFDAGDTRDWYRWRYGSQKHYTPDYYKLGYLTIAGSRYLWDEAEFTALYLERINRRTVFKPFFNFQRTMKDVSGMKLKTAWEEIAAAQDVIWGDNRDARGPFDEEERLTDVPDRYTEYIGTTMLSGSLYAIRKGLTRSNALVRISKDGVVKELRPFAASTSSLMASEALGRIFWSEELPDPRWSLKGSSRIRYMDAASGRIVTLTGDGRMYNPAPSPDGKNLAVIELPPDGSSAVSIIDSDNGNMVRSYKAPDGLQAFECAWVDGHILTAALSEQGIGIYDAADGWRTVLAPSFANIKQLRSDGGRLLFVCDRDGVNELYSLEGNDVSKLSSSRNGASEFVVDGDDIYCSELSVRDRAVFRRKMKSAQVDFYDQYKHPVAEKLSQQEQKLKASDAHDSGNVAFSEVSRYRKLPNLLKIHSWAPVYINSDAVESLSLDQLYTSAGIGATVFFQNPLGSMSGTLGYSLATNSEGALVNTLNGRFTYSGRYPVVEASFTMGDRTSRQYNLMKTVMSRTWSESLVYGSFNSISVRGTVRAYIPFNFSRGGWSMGVVPQVGMTLSNDWLNSTVIRRMAVSAIGENGGTFTFFGGTEPGRNLPLTRMYASLRGYRMLSKASSGIYPRWGIGAEAGACARPGLTDVFTPSAFAYLYGYVPGIMDTHGIRLSFTAQKQFASPFSEVYTNIYPSGILYTADVQKYIASRYTRQSKATIEYAMPLLPLDCSALGPVAYLKNLELRGFFEGALYGGATKESFGTMFLYSTGASLAVRTGNFLWLPYDTRIGLQYSYNGGDKFSAMNENGAAMERHHIGFIFEISM